MAQETKGDLPVIAFESQAEWESWLEKNHETSAGLWVKIARVGSAIESLTYAEALDSALCYGWIDGQKGSYNDEFWLQRFTRRGARSRWSKKNCGIAEALIREGRMQPSGLEEVRVAREDGRWQAAYDSPAGATVPDDLRDKLAENPVAQAFFATLNSKNRYAILYRIQEAKRPETRARRIDKFIAMLNERKTIY